MSTDRAFRAHLKEVKLRGLYLSMASDIEHILTDISCRCLVRDESDREQVKIVFFEKMMMGKKIEISSMLLSKYLPLEDFSETFELLRKLNTERNLFAHSVIFEDEFQDDDFLLFKYIKKGERKEDRRNVRELIEFIEKCRAEVHKILEILMKVLKKRHWEKFRIQNATKPLSEYYNTPYRYQILK